jgi:hypothetical protein
LQKHLLTKKQKLSVGKFLTGTPYTATRYLRGCCTKKVWCVQQRKLSLALPAIAFFQDIKILLLVYCGILALVFVALLASYLLQVCDFSLIVFFFSRDTIIFSCRDSLVEMNHQIVLTPQHLAMMMPLATHPFPKPLGPKASACEIFVGDLSFFCQEHDLYNLFAQFGNVQNVRVIRNGHRKRSLTFGFITMSSPQEARDMMNLFNGHLFMGRNLK